MKKRLFIRAITGIILILILFFLSYKITLKLRTDKIKENTTVSVSEKTDTGTTTQPEVSDEPYGETDISAFGDLQELPDPIIVNMPSGDTWSLVVLNAFYKMNETYEPVVTNALEGTEIHLEKRVSEKFLEMYAAASADGITLDVIEGYVSPGRQTRRFNKRVEEFTQLGYDKKTAEMKAAFSVLPAGCNEANYGLSVDIGWQTDDFRNSSAYLWLKNNAADYGFVERYPADKTDITRFEAQPWHWRYVGVAYAEEMNAKNLCLEEYADKVN